MQSLAAALRPSPCVLYARGAGFDAGEHHRVVRGCLVQSVSGGGALAVTVRALRERRCGFDAGEHLSVVRGCLARSVSGNGANLWRRLFGRRRACSLRAALASRLACITVWWEATFVQSLATALWPSPCVLFARSTGFNAGEHHRVVRGCLRAVSGGGASAVNVSALREQRCGFNAGEHHSVVRGCLAQSVCFWRRLFGRRRACSLRAALASMLVSITCGGRLPSCSLGAAAVRPSCC